MVNIILRGLTLVSKFFLLVYLAKVLDPIDIGIYGLFTATVSYSHYLLGLDFYTYAQREMLSIRKDLWGKLILNQFAFYGSVYLVMLPFLLLVFLTGLLPWHIAGWFYLVLSLEHISQELCRLLVICSRVTLANVTLFFRGGAWVYVVVTLFKFKHETQGLTAIWIGWSIGVALSIVLGFWGVINVVGRSQIGNHIDWSWIRRGFKVAIQFLLGTLALRGLFTFDRYFLDLFSGKAVVGIYSFFMSIANALQSFADAGVISRHYPLIVSAYRTDRLDEYKHHLKNLAVGIVVLFILFIVGLFSIIQPILNYIGREVYSEHITILWVLIIAVGIYSISMVPHYALYSRKADRSIAIVSIISVLIFIAFSMWLTPQYGANGMAISVLIGMCCLCLLKIAILSFLNRNNVYKELCND
ncbi:hypothetical protein GURASL_23680 [Geotalea uraniireducens]|uniref:O-antigen/teichoic acid export membrane protein n=2 Tax=Geotalea uraniireducens TaxID=351604 RepID=A0ABM8EM01_9BACT|nr:hypothetical protein GURASL_23680 [Geotalea uraniireducens]